MMSPEAAACQPLCFAPLSFFLVSVFVPQHESITTAAATSKTTESV